MDQGHIIFRVLHHENISITMDAGVSLFFGLHGQYTISTAQESYTIVPVNKSGHEKYYF